MSEKSVTWWYYLPHHGMTLEDAVEVEVPDGSDAADVAARSHQRSGEDNGEWLPDVTIVVSQDRVKWRRFKSCAELAVTYTAQEVDEDDDPVLTEEEKRRLDELHEQVTRLREEQGLIEEYTGP